MADDFIRRSEAMNKINDIAAEFLKDHTIQCDIAAGVAVDIKNDVIKTLPAADVVEVVRCENCKHRTEVRECNDTLYFCRKKQNYIKLTDFCSYGERRDSTPSAPTE